MKTLIAVSFALLLALPAAASAASPEQAYLAARDAYVKAFSHGEADPDPDPEKHTRALADLETQLRKIIGPTTLAGFPAEGKIHLDTLSTEDEGFGLLDGLAYAIPLDDKAIAEKVSVVVTTRTLFETWLRAHKTNLQAAPKSDDFYRQALSTDSAVVVFAQLPVVKPAWARTAFGVLAIRTQDLVGSTPDEIDMVVVGAERAYAVTAKLEVAVGPITACEKPRQQLKAQAQAAWAAYERSGKKNEALSDKATKLEEQSDTAYVQCFATRPHDASGFAAAIKQAQALIDALPKK
jgi:hypothetical protein